MKIRKFLEKYYCEIFILVIGLLFGSFLMFSTFSQSDNNLLISTKAWSDFGSHIPLIRSFSLGYNFPPEYPLFPGIVIKYHFIFYAFVGILEKIGIPISMSLNIPSIIGFSLLTLMIYLFGKLIFKSKAVGILSVLFFLFNSSLTFIYYFKRNPLSLKSILNIPNIDNFQSFAPYDEGVVSAFWNLNIFTNQRHLAISFALSLFIIFILVKPIFGKTKLSTKIPVLLGIILGFSFFLHIAVFMMTEIVIFFLAVFYPKIRRRGFILLLTAGLIALPQYLYLNSSEGFKILFNPGFLTAGSFTFFKFTEFWIYNLGLSLISISIGFIFANWKQRKILLSFIPLFIIGNLLQFSPEIAANHKFFNYFILIGNMFSAYAIYVIWNKKNVLKLVAIIFTFFMVFGGIMDFFPLYNDHKISIQDYKTNPQSLWILKNTSPDSIFFNTTYLYNPASLAGRKIFLGWPYFAWSQGYDTEERGEIYKNILSAKNKEKACGMFKENNIDYVEIKIQNPPDLNIPEISDIYTKEFKPVYTNTWENYSIININKSCNNAN